MEAREERRSFHPFERRSIGDSIRFNPAQFSPAHSLTTSFCSLLYDEMLSNDDIGSFYHVHRRHSVQPNLCSSLIRSDTQPLFTHSHSATRATSMTMKFPKVSDLPPSLAISKTPPFLGFPCLYRKLMTDVNLHEERKGKRQSMQFNHIQCYPLEPLDKLKLAQFQSWRRDPE